MSTRRFALVVMALTFLGCSSSSSSDDESSKANESGQSSNDDSGQTGAVGGAQPGDPAPTGEGPIVQVTGGRYHTCALLRGGAVSCWGDNSKGQLGDGTTDTRSVPVPVTDLAGATFIAASSLSVCAAFADGHMECWGDDLGAELGDDRVSEEPTTKPVRVQGLP